MLRFSTNRGSRGSAQALFGLLYAPVDLLLSIPFNAWSCRHEFQVDRFALETTRQNETLINGLKRLAETNLSNLTPHPLTVTLDYSHPR